MATNRDQRAALSSSVVLEQVLALFIARERLDDS